MAVNASAFGPKPQWVTQTGAPASGYKLFSYVGGSVNTKQNTYTDYTGGVANPNPIVLDASGYVPNGLFFTAGQTYKLVLTIPTDTDPPTSPVWTEDGLKGQNDTTVTIDQWISGPTPTFVSGTSFTLAGDQTSNFQVNRRVKIVDAVTTKYATISASSYDGVSLTTVTVVNDGAALSSPLSAVSYGILSATNPSLPTIITGGLNARVSNPVGVPTINAVGPGTRQTIQFGPVDSSGFSAFGGSTGSTTVTAAGTLVASAAFGGNTAGPNDRIGLITNPSWTGLSTNGTMYLFLDVNADGTCTTGFGTLVPVYQWGGTYSTTANQFTFNIQEMTAKVGTGAVANQAYRVYVGEVTVAGGVVTVITWYQLMGQYDSGFTATLQGGSSQTAKSHNLGIYPEVWDFIIECTTIDATYAVGDRLKASGSLTTFNGATSLPLGLSATRMTMQITTSGGGNAFNVTSKTGFANVGLTAASWKYKLIARRGW